jgi:predicted O-methyltransferase YrrM
VFDLITNVVEQPLSFYAYQEMDRIRLHLRLHDRPVNYRKRRYSIRKYLRKQEISNKEGKLLFRLANHYKPFSIVTVGSGVGLIPLYLAGYASNLQCIAFESENEIAETAEKTIHKKGNQSIRLIRGDYNLTLPEALNNYGKIDCLYISKLLSVEETAFVYRACKSFIHDETILIVSGIHSSAAKQKYWKHLCKDPEITVAVDLCKLGVVFFRPKLHKRMYKNRF